MSSKRRPKFGPRVIKVLKFLVENPYSTQKEILAQIKPEEIVYDVVDYENLEALEIALGRRVMDHELPMKKQSSRLPRQIDGDARTSSRATRITATAERPSSSGV